MDNETQMRKLDEVLDKMREAVVSFVNDERSGMNEEGRNRNIEAVDFLCDGVRTSMMGICLMDPLVARTLLESMISTAMKEVENNPQLTRMSNLFMDAILEQERGNLEPFEPKDGDREH